MTELDFQLAIETQRPEIEIALSEARRHAALVVPIEFITIPSEESPLSFHSRLGVTALRLGGANLTSNHWTITFK